MGWGIGSALKRGAKSIGKKIKNDPLKFLADPLDVSGQLKRGAKAGVGAVQDVLIPEIPGPDKPGATAPTPDDELLRRAKQRASQRKYAKAGRAGTMLTNDGGTLG